MSITCRVHVDTADRRAIDWLAEACDLSRSQLKDAMNKGAVWLLRQRQRQRLRRATKCPQVGDTLELWYDPELLARTSPAPTLVADEGRYSVWSKPAGMLAQGNEYGDHCALLRFVEQQLRPQRLVFLVHRLDREASGLMLVAHDGRAAAALSELWSKRDVDKRYCVSVAGRWPQADWSLLDGPLDGREALTEVRLLNYLPDADRSDLEVRIHTGRKHQIRRHLAAAGFPVIGDYRYGRRRAGETLQLRATGLSFNCPLRKVARDYQWPADAD